MFALVSLGFCCFLSLQVQVRSRPNKNKAACAASHDAVVKPVLLKDNFGSYSQQTSEWLLSLLRDAARTATGESGTGAAGRVSISD